MSRRSNFWLVVLGAAILFGGLGGMLWGMQQGISNEEMLAQLDTGEQGFFEPAKAQADPELAPVSETSSHPTATASPRLVERLYLPLIFHQPVETVTLEELLPTPTALPSPTPEPTPAPEIPARISIPTIGLDAPVVSVEPQVMYVEGQEYRQWASPDEFAAGWHDTSALLNQNGNLVLNGHNNIYGSVFQHLDELKQGDIIYISAQSTSQMYLVSNIMLLEERSQSLEVRLQNASWIQPADDRRLTLITCWPITSNTHRLIVVAVPYP
jgi:LPXTG-site transpeptidase (sortase) family protein